MNEISLKFANYSPPRLRDFVFKICTALTTEPGKTYFAVTKPPVSEIVALNTRLDDALGKETSTSVAAQRASLFDELSGVLKLLAGDLEIQADTNVVKLSATGFDLKKKPGGRSTAPTPTPQNARAKHGLSGQIVLRVDPAIGARMFQGGWSLDAAGPYLTIDPVSNSQKILFNDLERGKDHYLVARALGPNGASDWSDVVKIMVI